MLRRFFIMILTFLNMFLIYETIGSIIIGVKNPILYDGEYATFMGMYLMAITYFVLFIISLSLEIALIKKSKNHK